MAQLNLDYYDSKDIYNDGSIEDRLLEFYRDKKKLDFSKDDVFYLTTDVRNNILNWYPFTKKDSVLEIGCGCGTLTEFLCNQCAHVTCVEGSKRRSEITYYRHKNKDNLEIYAANFDTVKLNKKFDYIILIGVFEYAKQFFDSSTPFDDFLVKIKKLLKSTGKVLIAIENRYGIKYFAGANEDHLISPYVGLEGYEQFNVQTFGKKEFTDLIEKYGFSKSKFYYPFPDYKLPSIIYTDKRVPKKNEIFEIPIYPYGSPLTFDIPKALRGFLDNDCFGFFSNSFLVEFGGPKSNLSEVLYAKNTSTRMKDFKIITVETEDQRIEKIGCSKKALKHLEQLKITHDLLNSKGIKACHITREDNKFVLEKIEGTNVVCYIESLLREGKITEVEQELDHLIHFYHSISVKEKITNPIIAEIKKVYKDETYVLKVALLDGNVSNIVRSDNGEYIFIDQEWIDSRQLPTDYLIYHSLSYIFGICKDLLSVDITEKIYKKYGINEKKKKLCGQIEQYYYNESQKIIDDNTKRILDGCTYFPANSEMDRNSVLYYDTGCGFNEKEKIQKSYFLNDKNEYQVEYEISKDVKELRFYPVTLGNKLLYLRSIRVNGEAIEYDTYNIPIVNGKKALIGSNPYISFQTSQPKIVITVKIGKLSDSDIETYLYTQGQCSIEKDLECSYLKDEICQLNTRLELIINSKGWRLLEKLRKIKNNFKF